MKKNANAGNTLPTKIRRGTNEASVYTNYPLKISDTSHKE